MNLWHIREEAFHPSLKHIHSQETVYSIGNGYFCTRGSFEEGYPKATPATLLFGVFDEIPVAREELANTPDWTTIKLFVNGERFRLDRGTVIAYQRTLDMQHGIIQRTVRWESPRGTRIRVTSERFASLTDEHVGAIRYSVTLEEHPGDQPVEIAVRSTIDTPTGNYDVMHWESIDQGFEDNLLWLLSETKRTRVRLAQSMSFLTRNSDFRRELTDSDIAPSIRYYGTLRKGETFSADKIVTMFTTRDGTDNPLQTALVHHRMVLDTPFTPEPDIRSALALGSQSITPAQQIPSHLMAYDQLLASSKRSWERFWQIADVIIEGDEKAQLGMRYNLYQLRINTSLHDSRYSIAAKGLTGFGYRGHIFHDTEIFMLPFFTYVMPDVARNLLLYRYRLLPAARQKAISNGYEGAQYPWESTLSGEETTPGAIIHPETGEVIPVLNGYIEQHITASVAHAVHEYWRVTTDNEFMISYGAELLLDTAKFWASRAEKNESKGYYEITDVIGPDEWHEHVDNNIYTNYMAKRNIQYGLEILDWLKQAAPQKATALIEQLDLTQQRLNVWHDVAQHLHIPQDPQTGVFEQFEGFFNLATLDQEQFKGRTDSYQGILGLPACQKYRIIKQADVLMLLTVLSHEFDRTIKKANWDYYYPITDHDFGSSLTPALHVILACQLGEYQNAYKLFMKGAMVDLENLRHNTPEGIHTACAGAVWQAAILGFAGLEITSDGYTLNPNLPDQWTRLSFNFYHHGKLEHVDLQR